jgi:hypothetical protein
MGEGPVNMGFRDLKVDIPLWAACFGVIYSAGAGKAASWK